MALARARLGECSRGIGAGRTQAEAHIRGCGQSRPTASRASIPRTSDRRHSRPPRPDRGPQAAGLRSEHMRTPRAMVIVHVGMEMKELDFVAAERCHRGPSPIRSRTPSHKLSCPDAPAANRQGRTSSADSSHSQGRHVAEFFAGEEHRMPTEVITRANELRTRSRASACLADRVALVLEVIDAVSDVADGTIAEVQVAKDLTECVVEMPALLVADIVRGDVVDCAGR